MNTLKRIFLRWEMVLILVLLLVNVFNTLSSPYYLSVTGLLDATRDFMDKSFIVFPMAMIILLGEIDISVGATIALSSVVMGVAYDAGQGIPMVAAILLALIVGTVCGLVNGLILTRFKELSPMIVTLATMTIYRGIAYIILEDQAAGKFPTWFQQFGWGSVGPVPYVLIVFLVLAIIFSILLNRMMLGRRIYAIGSNRTASIYSGIKVDQIRILAYTLAGTMSGLTAIFLTSRMSSTRPNIGYMYELDIISMVVLGGISTSGGKGKLLGALISIFVIGLLKYGLGLNNIDAQILMIVIGLLLIISVITPNLISRYKRWNMVRKSHAASKALT
ncbi:MAG: ABC transporter permease [Eubacteriales bacterium]|nr:ABC transporter permease [Eubacteriales bacterium]